MYVRTEKRIVFQITKPLVLYFLVIELLFYIEEELLISLFWIL